MKKDYLLVGLLLLTCPLAMCQGTEVYAALSKPTTQRPQQNKEANPLKQALTEIERSFQISIAYKDEWVDNKQVAFAAGAFKGPEQALDSLLKDTGLYYEKAGERFYVIYKKQLRSLGAPQSSVALMPSMWLHTAEDFAVPASNTFIGSLPELPPAITVTGTIKDENGETFPGVNVVIKGTTNGTTTDADGKYSLTVDNDNATLVFSFVGYKTQEVAIAGRSIVDVILSPDVQSLDEVVVTALGIERSARTLGYSTTKVKADELTINRTSNPLGALQGKVAGVNISTLGSGPAGTAKIRIRGQSSMSGQNNPLIVVNGVPIDNTNYATNPNNASADGSIQVRGGGNTSDGGDGLSSINPDDIETMTVLKGAPAAALYGARAKDGVIMITTKSRGVGKGIGVTYNINYTDEKPLDFTDYQYEYGQGENGIRPTAPNPTSGQWSFGEKFQPGMTQVLFNGLTLPYEPVYDRIDKFFRHGQNMTNTLTLSSNSDKGGLNLSIADMHSKGIVPNNTFNRKTVNLGFTYDLSSKLSVKGNINYSYENNRNPPNIANQDNSIPTSLYNLANSMPLDVLKANRYNANGDEYIYSRFQNRTNPYFTLSDQFQNIRRDRIFGNITLRYNILQWLSIQGRVGQDYYSRDQDYNNFPTGQASRGPAPAGFVNGMYTQDQRRFRELNTDVLITANKEFGDFGVNVNLGANRMYRRTDLNSVQVTDFSVRGLYTVQNGRSKDPLYELSEKEVNSMYASAEFSWRKMLFLNGTGRYDYFSTLSKANRKIFYPSVSVSYVFTESIPTLPSWLTFGKVRAAIAEVGSDTDVSPYSDKLYYSINGNLLNSQPLGGPNSTTLPNPNLRPMSTIEGEVGLELRMFKGRVGLDAAVYTRTTKDQIVQAQISDASGFIDTKINSGESRNRGVELMFNYIPIETENFSWDFTFTGSYNITKVLSLSTSTPGERITVGTHVFNGELRQVVGEELAQIAGFGYRRDENGNKIFGANGIPLRTLDLVNFGSALPKWVGGFNNAFNYKGVTLSFLIDFKLGNKMLSGTNFNLIRHGLHKMTLEGREGGVVGEGVNVNGEVNTVVASVQPYWEVVRSQQLVEPAIYNGGYWKLRQVTLGYDFTKFIPESWPVKGLKLNLVSNNVLLLKKWVDNIDPETFGYSSDNLAGLESTGLPSTRSMGFNLNVKF